MSNLTDIVIGLIVVGLLLVRQLQARPAEETSSIRIVVILGPMGPPKCGFTPQSSCPCPRWNHGVTECCGTSGPEGWRWRIAHASVVSSYEADVWYTR